MIHWSLVGIFFNCHWLEQLPVPQYKITGFLCVSLNYPCPVESPVKAKVNIMTESSTLPCNSGKSDCYKRSVLKPVFGAIRGEIPLQITPSWGSTSFLKFSIHTEKISSSLCFSFILKWWYVLWNTPGKSVLLWSL